MNTYQVKISKRFNGSFKNTVTTRVLKARSPEEAVTHLRQGLKTSIFDGFEVHSVWQKVLPKGISE